VIRPHFTPDISLGQILQALVVITIGAMAIAVVSGFF
jgi:ribosome-associated protein YbcJ (S4-like RNA binding protein)